MSGENAAKAESGQEVSQSERLLFGGELAYDIGWSRHQGAWLALDLWAMARTLPKLVGVAVRLAHQADARALRIVWLAELGRGIAQAVGLVAVNSVLGHLLAGGSTVERLERAVPALMTVAVTALLLPPAVGVDVGHRGTGAEGAAGGDGAVPVARRPGGAVGDRGRRVPPAAGLRRLRGGFGPADGQVLHLGSQLTDLVGRRGRRADRPAPRAFAVADRDDAAERVEFADDRQDALHLLSSVRSACPCRAVAGPAADRPAGRRRGPRPRRRPVPAHPLSRHGADQ